MAAQTRTRQSLYDVLGIRAGASDDDVRRAYKTLARKYHPDLNPGNPQAETMFKTVGRAYEVLVDADKRAAYDEQLDQEAAAARPAAAPEKRKVDFILVAFGLMLILAIVFFFVDTPKGIYFLVVAIALEIRTAIESLRAEFRDSRK